jgi:hypothetical protein
MSSPSAALPKKIVTKPVPKPDAGQKKGKSKAGKDRKGKKKEDAVQLPMLVEFAFTFSVILIILLDLIVAAISFISGARLLDIVIRTGVATLTMGGLLWLLSWQLSTGALEAALAEQEESDQADEGESTDPDHGKTTEA